MDPFVHRLVQRLLDPAQPLSRNRHFATLNSAEGRAALKVTRRLRSLQRDVKRCIAEGAWPSVVFEAGEPDGWRLELPLGRVRGSRSTWLSDEELRLLRAMPGMPALIAESGGRVRSSRQ